MTVKSNSRFIGHGTVPLQMSSLVGSKFRKKTSIFTFDGKIEQNVTYMLIVFLDVCQQPYGWIPGLEMLSSLRIRSKVKCVLVCTINI